MTQQQQQREDTIVSSPQHNTLSGSREAVSEEWIFFNRDSFTCNVDEVIIMLS